MNTPESSVFIPAEDRKGTPKELFFIWFAGNIGILGVVYGAMIVGFQLSFLQSLLAAAVGALSFALVGYLSLAGRDAGTTTFVLSEPPSASKETIFLHLWAGSTWSAGSRSAS